MKTINYKSKSLEVDDAMQGVDSQGIQSFLLIALRIVVEMCGNRYIGPSHVVTIKHRPQRDPKVQ
jgi:hypothetical protein